MRINDHYDLLKEEFSKLGEGISFGQYGCTECGGKKIRGPHVDIMIPADISINATVLDKAVNLIDEHLCRITWDRKIEYGEWSGIHKGVFFKLILDKITT